MRHNYRRTVRSLWTWLWDRYHVPQNVFLVLSISFEPMTFRRIFFSFYRTGFRQRDRYTHVQSGNIAYNVLLFVSETFTWYNSNNIYAWQEILAPSTLAFSCKVVHEKLSKSFYICKNFNKKSVPLFHVDTVYRPASTLLSSQSWSCATTFCRQNNKKLVYEQLQKTTGEKLVPQQQRIRKTRHKLRRNDARIAMQAPQWTLQDHRALQDWNMWYRYLKKSKCA